MTDRVTVVGAGLAGSEAAWQLARSGVRVHLIEMRPGVMTPAHRTDLCGELVCSNSLKADGPGHASGLLKRELRQLGSLVMSAADRHRVPAGRALAVDRHRFSKDITDTLLDHPAIELERSEAVDIPDPPAIIASGPLTSDRLAARLAAVLGSEDLFFFDAIAPICSVDSIDWDRAFWGNRYGDKTGGDYVNCPLTADEYRRFRSELVAAEQVPLREFERDRRLFEGCLPIEELARRGEDTMRFGPLKPVGLTDPNTGERPYAVVQLRREDVAGTLLNLVGFQTNLRQAEQDRVFRLIPALTAARFVRYGSMHRNTFINAPRVLEPTLQATAVPGLFVAGQLSGVEGYVESIATGLIAGINAGRAVRGEQPLVFPPETAHGALCRYITRADPDSFQPMNINFGLFQDLPRIRKREERTRYIFDRAKRELNRFLSDAGLNGELLD